MDKKRQIEYCRNCRYCEYDEIYIRETGDEIRIWTCQKDKEKYIDEYTKSCDQYQKFKWGE